MKLRDRIGLGRGAQAANEVAPRGTPPPPRAANPAVRWTQADRAYQELKLRIHRDLLERLDLDALGRMDHDRATAELKSVIAQLIEEQTTPLSQRDRESLRDEILHEVRGLGPIEPLMRDPEVSDILVNTSRQVYVERLGKLEPTPVIFRDDTHLLQIIDRIVSRVGRRIDESSPMVDARLADGSRVNAIIPPLALDGPILSIRRFGRIPLMVEDLIRINSFTAEMADLMRAMVRARLNMLVSGGTGSGKTTLLNCLSSFIPDNERIVTVEDSAELQLQQPHVVRLETRPMNIEGRGEVSQRDLVRNSLRMRPDRIIVGEVRGAECLDMLQAMNTGHDGSISTVHANSTRDSLNRLEMMMQMTGFDIPVKAMRQQISAALDAIIHTARLADGTRKITGISEVVGMEGDTIMLQELFTFQREGKDASGNIVGRFLSTGIRPHFADQLKHSGGEVDADALGFLRA
jgi:pilus assembly protein CpaF